IINSTHRHNQHPFNSTNLHNLFDTLFSWSLSWVKTLTATYQDKAARSDGKPLGCGNYGQSGFRTGRLTVLFMLMEYIYAGLWWF
ncbi:hypothetical protein, partial [Mobiluncus mulieris]|uniref:hypothetical protein n=1 Tax=Mobiluncus mulieris TaxID=2052 RepID=UPI0021E365DF